MHPRRTRPTPEQLAGLEGFEKIAFDVSDRLNRSPRAKRAAHSFLRVVGARFVDLCTKNLRQVVGLEHLTTLDPNRGVMLVGNHRSFFDMYVVASLLLKNTSWVEGMYFPVRSDFFYERPAGVAVNALMSALAMYPPVLRRPSARAFNEYTVEVLAELSAERGVVIGMHPEGTRNKTNDPYTLLPAQPGVGQIAHAGKPIVVPVFVLGLGNDFIQQIKDNFDRTGTPVVVHFGPPVDLERFYADQPRLRTYKRLADHLRDVVTGLGAQDRAFREAHGMKSLAKV
jgi:1-acyl-sn-glycerol-3-phosphate acyltransferase